MGGWVVIISESNLAKARHAFVCNIFRLNTGYIAYEWPDKSATSICYARF